MPLPSLLAARSATGEKECLVLFTGRDRRGEVLLHAERPAIETALRALMKSGEFTGKEGATAVLHQVDGWTKVVLAVLPENKPPFDGEALRRLGAALVGLVERARVVHLDLLGAAEIAKSSGVPADLGLRALAEGMVLKAYRFQKYKKEKPEDAERRRMKEIVFLTASGKAQKILDETKIVCEGTTLARDLVNEPSNVLSAVTLAARAKILGKESGFKVTVFEKKKIQELGMGGLLAVNRGSAVPPRLIIGEYRPRGARKTLLLVGKGLTFDTGGVSIKPAAGMGEMKCDMAGAAAVLGALSVAARLKTPVNVIGVIPSTDNKTGSNAQNPGDIITLMNGTTVEVDNTDAEGRLILGDALHYGITRFEPDLTIDLATLTGACVVALGQWAAGLLTNDEAASAALTRAGKATSERVWPLPMYDEYADQLKSHLADVKNVGGRSAGATTGGKFLEKFVGGKPWVHLDIAGVAFLEGASHYLPKEGTGFGVRLLTEFLKTF
jgi:leucyl aminopeptidase